MQRDLFTEEQDAFRLMIRDFIEREAVLAYPKWEQAGELPREFFRAREHAPTRPKSSASP